MTVPNLADDPVVQIIGDAVLDAMIGTRWREFPGASANQVIVRAGVSKGVAALHAAGYAVVATRGPEFETMVERGAQALREHTCGEANMSWAREGAMEVITAALQPGNR